MKKSKFNDFELEHYSLADKLMEVFYDDSIKKESIPVMKSRLVSELKDLDTAMKNNDKMKHRKIWWGIHQLILEIDKPQKLIDENKQLRSQNNNLKESVNKTEHYWRDIVKVELKDQFDIDKVSNKWFNQLQNNRELTENIMLKNTELQNTLDSIKQDNKLIGRDDFQGMCEREAEKDLIIIDLKKQVGKKQVPESKTINKLKKQNKRLQRTIDELKDKYENSDSELSDTDSEGDDR